jgi:hypothetical protein
MRMSIPRTVRVERHRSFSLIPLAACAWLVGACADTGPDDLPTDEPGLEALPGSSESDIGGISAALEEGALLAEEDTSCLDGITNYGARGPFRYSSRRVGSINMLVPSVPAGCQVPVAHLANGTGARCSTYQSILNALASHGFLATCYESTNTGAGDQGLQAFERAIESYPNLAARRFASLGHSQGGQAAFTVLALTEARFGTDALYAGLAMQPASGYGAQPRGGSWQQVYSRIRSPMFMFSGTRDFLVSASWVRRGFEALDDDTEAYNWSARGSTHIPTPNAETIEVAIPWFRWKLLGDSRACERFKSLRNGITWSQRQVQNEADCN